MTEDDTVKLLRECNSGIKMGVATIDDVLEKVEDKGLYKHIYCSNGSATKEKNRIPSQRRWHT